MADYDDTLEQIFDQAISIADPAERESFVERACRDPELRRSIRELLELHESPRQLLGDTTGMRDDVSSASPPEQVGTQIGPYKVLQQIGEGGFGVVYMAEQQHPVRRKVALKIVKPGMDSRQVIARFEAERQALAMMDHANIARVLDAGAMENGRPYFVMELVRGVAITEYADKNHLSTRERLKLFDIVCRAVQHAHQKGVIHRDIKPSNVMITLHDGQPVVKVIDFGIAKALDQKLTEKTLFTAYGQMIGTPQYMSPEQAEMSGLDVDTRSDVYTLGVLLYELLTGTTPLSPERLRTAGFAHMLRLIQEDEPPKPSTRLSSLGETLTAVCEHRCTDPKRLGQLVRGDLDWIVMKALEKDRTRRYDTPQAMALDIRRHLNQEPVSAGPPDATYRIGKFIRRNRVLVTAMSSVVIALALGFSASLIGLVQASRARDRALRAESSAREEQRKEAVLRHRASRLGDLATQRAEENRALLYASNMHLAVRAWEAGNIYRVRDLLVRHVPKNEPDLRGFEWYYLWQLIQPGLTGTTLHHEGAVLQIDFSQDGRQLVTTGPDPKRWDLASELAESLASSEFPFFMACRFLRDQQTLAIGGMQATENRIALVNLKTQVTAFLGPISHPVHTLAVSPDGTQLASGGGPDTVEIWDLAKQRPYREWKRPADFVSSLCYSSTGDLLACGGGHDGHPVVWNVSDGELKSQFETDTSGVGVVVAFAGEHQLITGGLDGEIRFWDITSGRRLYQVHGHEGDVRALTVSSDGTRFASGGKDSQVVLWNVKDRRKTATLKGHAGAVRALAFSPNGQTLASGSDDGRVKLWNITRLPRRVLKDHSGPVHDVAFSPSGNWIVTASSDRTIKIWDTLSGRPLHSQPVDTEVLSVDFSSDGRMVAAGTRSGKVILYDAVTRSPRTSLAGHSADVWDLAFSPDGKRLASSSHDNTVKLWDWRRGSEERTLQADAQPMEGVVFSPDGKLLAAGNFPSSIVVWDVESGQRLKRLTGHRGRVFALTFSSDGHWFASAGDDARIFLWDFSGGWQNLTKPSKILEGHAGMITSLAFFQDNLTLASCSGDNTVRLWDLTTGEQRASFTEHGAQVQRLAISPDNMILASVSNDQTLVLRRAARDAEVDTNTRP